MCVYTYVCIRYVFVKVYVRAIHVYEFVICKGVYYVIVGDV